MKRLLSLVLVLSLISVGSATAPDTREPQEVWNPDNDYPIGQLQADGIITTFSGSDNLRIYKEDRLREIPGTTNAAPIPTEKGVWYWNGVDEDIIFTDSGENTRWGVTVTGFNYVVDVESREWDGLVVYKIDTDDGDEIITGFDKKSLNRLWTYRSSCVELDPVRDCSQSNLISKDGTLVPYSNQSELARLSGQSIVDGSFDDTTIHYPDGTEWNAYANSSVFLQSVAGYNENIIVMRARMDNKDGFVVYNRSSILHVRNDGRVSSYTESHDAIYLTTNGNGTTVLNESASRPLIYNSTTGERLEGREDKMGDFHKVDVTRSQSGGTLTTESTIWSLDRGVLVAYDGRTEIWRSGFKAWETDAIQAEYRAQDDGLVLSNDSVVMDFNHNRYGGRPLSYNGRQLVINRLNGTSEGAYVTGYGP